MVKKNKIDQEYESYEKNIHQLADGQIRNIESEVNKIRKEAEKMGEEVENSITEKTVKSKNSLKHVRK
jgi:uncharacterized protein (DUF3084 family)